MKHTICLITAVGLLFVPALPDGGSHGPCVYIVTAPHYPDLARLAAIQGSVLVDIEIDADGSVLSASALTGHALLQKEAAENVKSWRFQPDEGTRNAPRALRVTYEFVLRGQPTYYSPRPRVTFRFPNSVEVSSQPPTPFEEKK